MEKSIEDEWMYVMLMTTTIVWTHASKKGQHIGHDNFYSRGNPAVSPVCRFINLGLLATVLGFGIIAFRKAIFPNSQLQLWSGFFHFRHLEHTIDNIYLEDVYTWRPLFRYLFNLLKHTRQNHSHWTKILCFSPSYVTTCNLLTIFAKTSFRPSRVGIRKIALYSVIIMKKLRDE